MFEIQEIIYRGKHPMPQGSMHTDSDKGYAINLTCWGDPSIAEEFMNDLNESFDYLDTGVFQASDLNTDKTETPTKLIAFKNSLKEASARLYKKNSESLKGFLNLSALLHFEEKFYLIHCGAPFVFLFSKNKGSEILATPSISKSNGSTYGFFMPQNPIGYEEEFCYQERILKLSKNETVLFVLTESLQFSVFNQFNLVNWTKAFSHLQPDNPFWGYQLKKT